MWGTGNGYGIYMTRESTVRPCADFVDSFFGVAKSAHMQLEIKDSVISGCDVALMKHWFHWVMRRFYPSSLPFSSKPPHSWWDGLLAWQAICMRMFQITIVFTSKVRVPHTMCLYVTLYMPINN